MKKQNWLALVLLAKTELMKAGYNVIHNGYATSPTAIALVAWNETETRLIRIGGKRSAEVEPEPPAVRCPPFSKLEVWKRDETQPGGWQITILKRNEQTP